MAGATIVFVESAGQADAASKLSPRPDIFLALSPTAADKLESLGIAYRKGEDFYDEKEFCNRADSVMNAQVEWIAWADEWFAQRAPDFRKEGFKPAAASFFYLKMLFDELLLRGHILQAIAKDLHPRKAVFYARDGEQPFGDDLFFRESLISLSIPAWGSSNQIELERLPPVGDERFQPPRRSRPIRWQAATRTLRSFLSALRTVGGRRVLCWPIYDVELTVPLLREKGVASRSWLQFMKSVSRREEIAGLSDIVREPRWKELQIVESIDLSSVAASRLSYWINHVVPKCWGTFLSARRQLLADRIKGIFLPFTDSPAEIAVLQAAKREHVPTIIYQHGGFAGPCQYSLWEQVDLRNSDIKLLYGNGTLAHYKNRLAHLKGAHASMQAIGSARLDSLAVKNDVKAKVARSDKPIVLYFPTVHSAYTRYLCLGEMPDVSHWELQRDIVRVFKKFPQVQLVYRPFEGSYSSPMPDFLARELPSARIDRDTPLVSLCRAVDAIITDIPSTGLLEALLSDRPVLVYADAKSIRLTDEGKTLLSKRAQVEQTPALFIDAVEAFLRAGDFGPIASPDYSFLRAYGTHLGDGRSADRAVDTLIGALDA